MELSSSGTSALLYGTALFTLIAGLSFYGFNLHRGAWSYTSVADLTAIAAAATWASCLFLLALLLVDRAAGVPRSVPAIQWFILVVLLSSSRLGYRFIKTRALRAPARFTPDRPVLLYGCGPVASLFVRAAQSMPGAGVRVVGIVDDVGDHHGRRVNGVPVVGHARDLGGILARLALHGVHPCRLVVARAADELPDATRADLEAAGARYALEVEYLPALFGLRDGGAPAAAPARDEPIRPYFRLRRVAEVALSGAALLALLPVIAAVAALVLLDGGRPILFRQVRPGRCMRPFTLYKFRTMRIAFAADGTPVDDDARTTAIGRLLRRTRLDELPQLYNVLVGDMAFIGPRPLLPRDLPAEVTERALLRPGITGWAQVNGGHRLTTAEKTALDVWYVRHAGPAIDARIVRLTVRMMLFGERINHAEILRATAPASAAEPPAPAARPRLLIVNRCFHPDQAPTAQLLTDLVAALDRERLAVTVFTARQRYDDPHALLPPRDDYRGAEVRRLLTTRFGRAWLPGRAIDDATFFAAAFLALLAHARRGDVLLAKTDPPLISVVAWAVARLTGARLVNWCQDLFPEIAAALGVRPARGPAGALLRAVRNRSLNAGTLNVVLCERMAERLAGEGVPARSVAVIHNWVDGEAIRPLAPDANPLRRAWGLAGTFVVGYSGNLGRVHDVDSVVELVEALGAEPDLVCLFIGAGWGHRRLKDAVAARGIPNVRFRPYQPRERLALSLPLPDLHLVTLSPACEGLIMPSKLYGALAAGRPVAFVGDPAGGVARILRAHDAGLVGAPGHMPVLAAQIRGLRRDPVRLERLGANARRAYDDAFNREASLSAWVRHLDAIAAAPAPAPAPRLAPAA